jgi:hypothetical protein
LFLAGAGAALAVSRASGQLAAFLMFPLFAVALITSVSAGRRMSGLVTLACVAMIVVLRVRVEPFSTTPQYLAGLGQFVLLITVGSALTLFLNALSEERQLQAQRLRLQAETNEVSDLPNLRALQAMLSECSRNERCTGLTLVEVGVMDAMRWADLAGRTPVDGVRAGIRRAAAVRIPGRGASGRAHWHRALCAGAPRCAGRRGC